jgi:hypothetical protein
VDGIARRDRTVAKWRRSTDPHPVGVPERVEPRGRPSNRRFEPERARPMLQGQERGLGPSRPLRKATLDRRARRVGVRDQGPGNSPVGGGCHEHHQGSQAHGDADSTNSESVCSHSTLLSVWMRSKPGTRDASGRAHTTVLPDTVRAYRLPCSSHLDRNNTMRWVGAEGSKAGWSRKLYSRIAWRGRVGSCAKARLR